MFLVFPPDHMLEQVSLAGLTGYQSIFRGLTNYDQSHVSDT